MKREEMTKGQVVYWASVGSGKVKVVEGTVTTLGSAMIRITYASGSHSDYGQGYSVAARWWPTPIAALEAAHNRLAAEKVRLDDLAAENHANTKAVQALAASYAGWEA